MSLDDLHLRAVEALRALGATTDEIRREEYMRSLLTMTYQAGMNAANVDAIRRMCVALHRNEEFIAEMRLERRTGSR